MPINMLSNNQYVKSNIKYENTKKNEVEANQFQEAIKGDIKATANAETHRAKANGNAFDSLAPNAPESVKNAWDKAEQETGANGAGKGSDGKLTHISAMLTLQIEQRFSKGHSDLLGSTKESAMQATQMALNRLMDPLMIKSDTDILEAQKKEQSFYEAFLKNLSEIE